MAGRLRSQNAYYQCKREPTKVERKEEPITKGRARQSLWGAGNVLLAALSTTSSLYTVHQVSVAAAPPSSAMTRC